MTRCPRWPRLLAGVLVAAGALALLPAPGARGQDAPVQLRYTYKAGRTARYTTTQTGSVMGADLTLSAPYTITVKQVRDDGSAVVERKQEAGKISIGGQEQETPAADPQSSTRDRRGRLLEYNVRANADGFIAPEVTHLLASLTHPLLPEKAVAKGDTWQVEVDNPADAGKKVTVKGTFLGVEKLDGADAWKLRQSAEATTSAGADTKLVVEFTAWLDPANGEIRQMEGTVKDLPTQAGPITLTVKQTREKA